MPYYSIDGLRPVVSAQSYVHPTATIIGDVIIADHCYVGPSAVLRGDFGRLILHEGANVQDTCVMHSFPEMDSIVECNGHIGHGAILHGCHIGENSLIGMNSIIMDGAKIGRYAMVAAMSFVPAGMQVPDKHLAMGCPAKITRQLSDQEITWKTTGTESYQQLVHRCLLSMVETTPLEQVEKDRKRIVVDNLIPLHKSKENQNSP